MQIGRCAIDSGYSTQAVYDFVRRHPGQCIAVKGVPSCQSIIGSPIVVDISERGRTIKVRAVKVWPVGGHIAKFETYAWLRLEPPTEKNAAYPAGYCHFPQHDAEYFKQLTGEELVAHTSRVRRNAPAREEWALIPGRQNHVLDCRVYARAAAAHAGMDRLTDAQWDAWIDRQGGSA
jgi:phage terminase large subunit GpA-like protein